MRKINTLKFNSIHPEREGIIERVKIRSKESETFRKGTVGLGRMESFVPLVRHRVFLI
jgi:hypothetical protein